MTKVSEFQKLVGLDVIGCPTDFVKYQTLQAIIEFCQKSHVLTRALQFTISSTDIDDDINDYIDIDLAEYTSKERFVTLLRLNINGTDWRAFKKNFTEDVTNFDDLKKQDNKYFDLIGNTTLRFFDVSSTETSWYMEVAFKPLQSATVVADILYEDWLEPIVAGAKQKLLTVPNKPWSDAQAATHYMQVFHRGMSEASMTQKKGHTNEPGMITPQTYGNPRW
jgi:hypothetical protein